MSARKTPPFRPTDKKPPDGKVYCRRPDGTVYAVLRRSEWRELQEQGKVNESEIMNIISKAESKDCAMTDDVIDSTINKSETDEVAVAIDNYDDESYIDVNSVLDKPEAWARDCLRNDGLSGAFIDAWIQMDNGLDLEVAIKLVTSESDFKIMLLQHIEGLRDQLRNGNKPPMDWIWDGYLLAWFQFTGSMTENEKIWFSELQSERGSGPKDKTTLAQKAVNAVLEVADEFPGTVQLRSPEQQLNLDNARKGALPERGRDLDRFRHYVGESNRVEVGGMSIEITSIEDARGKIIGYAFDNRDLPSNERPDMTPMSTIRSIISRRNSEPSRKIPWAYRKRRSSS